ncbi:MAG: restriction endonuclease [Bacilli bacterium]
MLIEYDVFEDELEKIIYRDAKSDLINKLAKSPDRYVELFRTTSPKLKLMQNITQSHEISFGDFVENIITMYLGVFYENLPKRAKYNKEDIMFDQLFLFENKVYMIEQKIRDDHDSTKKRGQFSNFISKINYLKENYPDKKIVALMWFVDDSLKKNRRYYLNMISSYKSNDNISLNIFYGNELFNYLDKIIIWDEMVKYLQQWKELETNNIELNFEDDWKETKKEIIQNVSKKNWN